MANPSGPPDYTRWKKGQSGNPGGKPKQLLTIASVSALMGRFAHLSEEQLATVLKDPKATVIEKMVGSVIMKAIQAGDYTRLSFLLDRTVGKVKDVSEVHQHNSYDSEFDKQPKENVLQLLREMAGPKG